MKDLHKELKQLRFDLDLVQKVYCPSEEEKQFQRMKKEGQALPVDIKTDETGSHFRYVDTDLTEQEIQHLFLYRQILYLRSIKNSMIFFVILSVLSLICSLIILR